MIGNTISALGNVLIVIFLVPAYIFMILYYRPLLVDFALKLSGSKNNDHVGEILFKTKTIIKSYITGLMIEMAIVFVLNTTGLFILGMDYALVLGLLGALFNLIPYIGSLIAASLYMIVALLTKDSTSYILYVGILYMVVQIIDNNFLVPKIVGSKVQINALVSIVAVISGGALWGIPGMFLAIPLTAIIKLVFDSINGMEPWAYLLGDTMPRMPKFNMDFIRKRLKKKEPPKS
jgi:predicted PurR-regulated permease PerM